MRTIQLHWQRGNQLAQRRAVCMDACAPQQLLLSDCLFSRSFLLTDRACMIACGRVAAKAAAAANTALKTLKPVRLSVAPFKYLLRFPPKVAHKVRRESLPVG
jgi:hypothetical protein